MIPFLLMVSGLAFAQTSFKTIVDDSILKKESMARTVFIRMYSSADTSAPIKGSGIILQDGHLLTNEHVLRPHLEGKKVAFHIFTHGKRILHKFDQIKVLGCDKANDICLLKTAGNYQDSYFTFESPSFRTITPEKPIGLFKDEKIFFNGFCSEFPETKKAKYIDLTSSAYEVKVSGLENRNVNTTAINFSSESGDGIACGGDSGGPLFDSNLYLYGMVRDSITTDNKKKNYAVPVSVLRDFFKKTKDSATDDKLTTIMDFSELGTIFK
jgi:S1-C subfamily serine protease